MAIEMPPPAPPAEAPAPRPPLSFPLPLSANGRSLLRSPTSAAAARTDCTRSFVRSYARSPCSYVI